MGSNELSGREGAEVVHVELESVGSKGVADCQRLERGRESHVCLWERSCVEVGLARRCTVAKERGGWSMPEPWRRFRRFQVEESSNSSRGELAIAPAGSVTLGGRLSRIERQACSTLLGLRRAFRRDSRFDTVHDCISLSLSRKGLGLDYTTVCYRVAPPRLTATSPPRFLLLLHLRSPLPRLLQHCPHYASLAPATASA